MTGYELALFLHVMGAIGLFTGVGIVLAAMGGMRRAQAVAQVREWARVASTFDKLLPVGGIVLLVTGIYMATDLEYWGDGWVDMALVLLLLLMVLGPAVNARRLGAIHKAADDAPDGPVPAELRARVLDPVLWTAMQAMTAVTVGIVFLMTVKPGMAGSGATVVVTLALGLAASVPAWRRAAARTAAAEGG